MEREFPNHLRSWIAENLARGCSAASIQETLKSTTEFDNETIKSEVDAAVKSPYTQGARVIGDRLMRREWLLKTLDKLARLDSEYPKIATLYEAPKYSDFLQSYVARNKPVLLKGAVKHWRAVNWTLDQLKERVGNIDVSVQSGRAGNENYEIDRTKHRKNINMKDFLEIIEGAGVSNDVYMTAFNANSVTERLFELVADYGNIGDGYLDMRKKRMLSDSAFWIGPAGTRTPMHFDTKNNLLVQLLGKKKIYLFPPTQIPYIYNLQNYYSLVQDFENYDRKKYPNLSNVKPVEVIVERGDALFIPVSWFHFVVSLEVSISHTFLNFSGLKNDSNDFPIFRSGAI